MIEEYIPDDAPLAWLDHKYPMEIESGAYWESFGELAQHVAKISKSAKKISRTKYTNFNEDFYLNGTIQPDTGYWSVHAGLHYIQRVEIRTFQQQKRRDPEWDLGAMTVQTTHFAEVPDMVLHDAVMRLTQSERRDIMKTICSCEYQSLVGNVHPNGSYHGEIQQFVRHAYEMLMRGQMHTSFGMDISPLPPMKQSEERKRRKKRS